MVKLLLIDNILAKTMDH